MAGQLRVDEITDEAGTGSPSFPFGLPVGYAAGGTAPAAGSFTEVPSNVLEVGDPIRSSDIIAIKNNTLFLFDAAISFPIIDQQRFDASGTWTKPNINTPEAATVIVLLVGGGGAGGRQSAGVAYPGGGGTGAVLLAQAPLTNTSSATITVGAGGAGAAGTNSNGATGGASTLVMTEGNLTASGGRGGTFFVFGVGGGFGGSPGGFSVSGPWSQPLNFGKAGRDPNFDNLSAVPLFSGGGAAGFENTIRTTNNGAGPAFALSLLNNEPLMGAGGAGGSPNGSNGSTFGAGGGGAAAASGTVTNGSGAAGGALVFVVRGIIDTSGFDSKYTRIP